ncbi:MAG TPA: substrate-binding domain-containing protein, partial [Thermomicrobiales bacterium]|nr:substrate-binding domain-containing protein [Thermomicrobiales bacterium]
MSDKLTVELARMVEASLSRRRLMQTAVAAGVVATIPVTLRPAAAQEPLKIAFSVPGLNFPFFVHMMKMAQAHAAELGNIDLVQLDGQDQGSPSSAKQSSDLEAAVASGVKGIVISPNDAAALAPAIQDAIDAGVVVVTVDRNVTGAKTLAHVGADNVKGGELQGEYVVKILPDGGDIYELQGQPGATPAIDRHKGLDNVLSKDDKINVAVSQTANFDRAQATSVFEAALQGNPPPKAVVCANDDMALGVVEVAKAQDLSVPILGYDSLPEALLAIRDGQMAATIEQFPGQQASQALDILVAYLRDK